jgi:uncharacterized protein involved in type VI secretion and phage assembly
MSVELSQESRLLRINTSVDKGFILRRVEAVEAISRPYVVQVEVLSLDAAVTAADMIGQTATVTIARDDTSPPRHFNGIINSFRKIGKFGTSYTTYGLEIVPSFWNLTRTSDARVFQNESVPTIVKKLCGEAGAAEPAFMSAPETPRPYCMQFNETDFDFAQRLMDEIGCGYYFVHSESEHLMLVASASADYQTNPAGPYKATASAAAWDSLTGFSHRTRLRPGAVQALDYDLQKHSNPLDSTTPTALTQVANNASFKMFHWPGGQHVRPDGSPSLLEMQTYESEADVAQGDRIRPGSHRRQQDQHPARRQRGREDDLAADAGGPQRLRRDAHRRWRRVGLFLLGHHDAGRPAVPARVAPAAAACAGAAVGHRGRPAGGGDPHRQARPGEDPLPVGPPLAEEPDGLRDLGARRAALRRQVGRHLLPAAHRR